MSIRLSKSGLTQWDICPRAYKYRYVTKIPTKESVPMQVGTSFHDFAHTFFEILDYELLEVATDRLSVKKIFESYVNIISTPKFIERYVENFIEFEVNRFLEIRELDDPMKYYKPLFFEKYVVSEDAVDGITLSGIIDRGDLTSSGTLALIEYKTSPEIRDEVEKELLFYTLLLETSGIDLPPVTHLIGYTPVKNSVRIWEVSKRKKDNLFKKILKVAKLIEKKKFAPKESPLCSTCQFLEICLNTTIEREEVLSLLSNSAYSVAELSIALDYSRDLLRDLLYDMRVDGQVKSAFDGNIEYWWVEQ